MDRILIYGDEDINSNDKLKFGPMRKLRYCGFFFFNSKPGPFLLSLVHIGKPRKPMFIDLFDSYYRIGYIHGLKSCSRNWKPKRKLNLRTVEPAASSTKPLAKK